MRNLTPPEFRCSQTDACPAVFEDEATGKAYVIGKIATPDDAPALAGKVGEGEQVIEIDMALLRGSMATPAA